MNLEIVGTSIAIHQPEGKQDGWDNEDDEPLDNEDLELIEETKSDEDISLANMVTEEERERLNQMIGLRVNNILRNWMTQGSVSSNLDLDLYGHRQNIEEHPNQEDEAMH